MRRGLVALVLMLAALAVAQPAAALHWARPQIKVVVDNGLMGPSVAEFRPNAPLTRGELGYALAALTGEQQVVVDPDRAVTLARLDAAVVKAVGLRPAAQQFQQVATGAGLVPPGRFGNEVVARLLYLRLNHPASADNLEPRPQDPATRAEAAYSFARVLALSQWEKDRVGSLAGSFSLPVLAPWPKKVLTRAVRFVGYPYIWGGTSEFQQVTFGVTSRGGFDCSGFVWRVYKLQAFPGGGRLPTVLRGRTTYQMSGEVPKSARIPIDRLKPADVVFFGANGWRSTPSEVDHMGIYVGRNWVIHSSSQGVTLVPLEGWYRDRFAWARRPLREAGLL
jgi:cell wall-associated NlpC family hydrolase